MYRKIKKKADHKVGVWEADEGAYFIAQNLSWKSPGLGLRGFHWEFGVLEEERCGTVMW